MSTQVASLTPALVPFIKSPFGDPAALWMPITPQLGAGGQCPPSRASAYKPRQVALTPSPKPSRLIRSGSVSTSWGGGICIPKRRPPSGFWTPLPTSSSLATPSSPPPGSPSGLPQNESLHPSKCLQPWHVPSSHLGCCKYSLLCLYHQTLLSWRHRGLAFTVKCLFLARLVTVLPP